MVASLSGHSSWVLSASLAADGRAAASGYVSPMSFLILGSAPSDLSSYYRSSTAPPTARSKSGT